MKFKVFTIVLRHVNANLCTTLLPRCYKYSTGFPFLSTPDVIRTVQPSLFMKKALLLLLLFGSVSLTVLYAQSTLRLDFGKSYDLPNAAVTANGNAIFVKNNTELWKTDGTPAGTKKIIDLPGTLQDPLVALGNTVFFKVTTTGTAYSIKLWKTDGTAVGTKEVKTLAGPVPGKVGKMTVLGNALLFFASTDTTAFVQYSGYPGVSLPGFTQRLWRTTGTDSSITLLLTRYGEVNSVYSSDSLAVFYFGNKGGYEMAASVSNYQGGLYRTDGTIKGTKGISPNILQNNALISVSTIYGQKDALFLSNGTNIWRVGYAPGSTAQLIPGLGTGESYNFIGRAGKRLFIQKNRLASGKDDGTDFMIIDSTGATPTIVRSFTGTDKLTTSPDKAIALNNKLLFVGTNTANGSEPWISDGTAAGTTIVKDLSPNAITGVGNSFAVLKNYAYFFGYTGKAYLFRTDGTMVNTVPVSASLTTYPPATVLVATGDKILYSPTTIYNGYDPYTELWAYDPTGNPNSCSMTVTTLSSTTFCSTYGSITAYPANGTAPYNFRWAKDSTPLSTTTTASLNVQASGLYSLTVTDACSSSFTSSFTLTAYPSPQVSISGICATPPTGLTATATSGTPPYDYQWSQFGGTSLVNSTSAVLANPVAGGSYQLYVFDSRNCNVSTSVGLPNSAKPLSVSITGSPVVCSDQKALLYASTSNTIFPYYLQWQQNGNAVGTSSSSLSITSGGVYSVTLTDACSTTTASFTVTDAVSPTLTVGGALTACITQVSTLTAAVAGGVLPYSYLWKQGSATVGSNAPSLTVTGGNSYSLTVTDAKGCAASSPALSISAVSCSPLPGRLAATGSELLSSLIDSQVTLYPNPTTGDCWVTIDVSAKQTVNLRLVDALGKQVRQWNGVAGPGELPIRVSLPGADGLYFLRIETEQGAVVKKVIRK